jgi:hypothetical protein
VDRGGIDSLYDTCGDDPNDRTTTPDAIAADVVLTTAARSSGVSL